MAENDEKWARRCCQGQNLKIPTQNSWHIVWSQTKWTRLKALLFRQNHEAKIKCFDYKAVCHHVCVWLKGYQRSPSEMGDSPRQALFQVRWEPDLALGKCLQTLQPGPCSKHGRVIDPGSKRIKGTQGIWRDCLKIQAPWSRAQYKEIGKKSKAQLRAMG